MCFQIFIHKGCLFYIWIFCFKIVINQLWWCYNAYIFFQTCVKSYKSNTFYFFDLHVEGAFISTKLVQVVAWLLNDILWFWNGKFAWSNHNDPSFSNVQEQHISMLEYTMSYLNWSFHCNWKSAWVSMSKAIPLPPPYQHVHHLVKWNHQPLNPSELKQHICLKIYDHLLALLFFNLWFLTKHGLVSICNKRFII
jgi:hypothetical protein